MLFKFSSVLYFSKYHDSGWMQVAYSFSCFQGQCDLWRYLFFSSVYVTIDPGTSSIVASPFCLFEFGLLFSGLCWQDFLVFSLSLAKGVFYTSPRICSLVQNKKEPPDHFKKCFCLFLTIYLFSHPQNLIQHKQKVLIKL